MTVEYSDASTDMMLSAPRQAVLLAGGAAFGSTDRMDAQTFWDRVSRPSTKHGCWDWQGRLSDRGYGVVSTAAGDRRAHRVAFEMRRGPIPEGMVLDHLCRNRRCVNPDHLEPVTPGTNVLRGVGSSALHARQTECIHGHPLKALASGKTPGRRYCQTCANARRARSRAALAAKLGSGK